MKKQKKLSLGKIKIADVNIANGLIGGATTTCNSGSATDPFPASCGCTQELSKCCEYSIPETACGTTQHTNAESNRCGVNDPSQAGEIC